ncbi:MAG: acyl-CoA synthetase [Crenarchaeota archaeon 13_1_40CM_3_53_5]|nr:MAG: acyl-CoA synthetase [Crenarchaeota archaeon 13_1_40CM_3_53_5]
MYLYDLATIFRSKNAGPFMTTIDILFKDRVIYDKVKSSSVINRETVATVYRIPVGRVLGIFYQDDAMGIKITFTKPITADDIFATDVYGAQQHAPLMKLKIDV